MVQDNNIIICPTTGIYSFRKYIVLNKKYVCFIFFLTVFFFTALMSLTILNNNIWENHLMRNKEVCSIFFEQNVCFCFYPPPLTWYSTDNISRYNNFFSRDVKNLYSYFYLLRGVKIQSLCHFTGNLKVDQWVLTPNNLCRNITFIVNSVVKRYFILVFVQIIG